MKVRYSATADADLADIYLHSFATFGEAQADAYITGLRGVVQMIGDYPLSTRLRNELTHPIRVRPYRSHVVLYTVDETGALILRFRHAQENWIEDLPGQPDGALP